MALTPSQQARLDAIGKPTTKTAPQGTGKAPAQVDFKTNYSNLTSENWNGLFENKDNPEQGELLQKTYENLMNGKDLKAYEAMQKTQPKTFNLWKQTYIKGKQMAEFYNTNNKTMTQSQLNELNKMRSDFINYQQLAKNSSFEVWDKNVDDYSKLKSEDKKSISLEDNKNRYRYDDETHQLITQGRYEELSNDVYREDDFYTNLKTKESSSRGFLSKMGPGNWIDMIMESATGYKKDNTVEQDITPDQGYKVWIKETGRVKPELKSKVNYVVKNWTQQSLTYINENHKDGFSTAIDFKKNRINASYLVQDIIKEGINSPDAEIKRDALKLNAQVNRKGISYEERTKIYQNPVFVQQITGLVSSSAFAHASRERLYKKYKPSFNTPKYINSNDLKSYSEKSGVDLMTAVAQRTARLDKEITMYLDMSSERKKEYSKTKVDYRNELIPTDKIQENFKELMFNGQGDLRSFGQFYSNLPKDGLKSKYYTPAVQKWIASSNSIVPRLDSFSTDEYRSNPGAENAQRNLEKAVGKKGMQEIEFFRSVYGNRPGIKNFGQKQSGTAPVLVSALQEQYQSFKSSYKQKWNDYEGNLIYPESSMNAGLNAKGVYALGQRAIDLNAETIKAVNANNIVKNVVKLTAKPGSGVYVKDGKWSYLDSIKDFQDEDASIKGNKLLNAFFKNQDKHKYDMAYVNTIKDSGQALYMFTDLTTKKQISIVLPKSTAKNMGEQFASNEYNDDDDFYFDNVGRQSLKFYGADEMKYAKDSEIVYNKHTGQKELRASMYEPDKRGILQFTGYDVVPLGHNQYLTLDNAVVKAMAILKEHEAQYK